MSQFLPGLDVVSQLIPVTLTLDLVWFAAALALAGALSGLLAGVFGIGGGTVIVPVLYEAFGWFSISEEIRMP